MKFFKTYKKGILVVGAIGAVIGFMNVGAEQLVKLFGFYQIFFRGSLPGGPTVPITYTILSIIILIIIGALIVALIQKLVRRKKR